MASKKLTMKLARELARKVFGTAGGLKKSERFDGRYEMRFGDLVIEIMTSPVELGLIEVSVYIGTQESRSYYDPDTLKRDYSAEQREICRYKRAYLEDLVDEYGAERCKAEIDRVAKRYN